MAAEFNFELAQERYNAESVRTSIFWPALDYLSHRDWRDRCKRGEQTRLSEHGDGPEVDIDVRLYAECRLAVLADDPEALPIDAISAGMNILELVTSETARQLIIDKALESVFIVEEPQDLVVQTMRLFDFSDYALPSITEISTITNKHLRPIWRSEDIYEELSDGVDAADQTPSFSEFELSQLELGLRIMNVPDAILGGIQAIRQNPVI